MNAIARVTPKTGKGSCIFMGLIACLLGYIIIKDVEVPRSAVAALTLLGSIILFVRGISKPEIVTYALVTYLPFSRRLPGDFAAAFNITNILMAFIMLVWLTGKYAKEEPFWLRTPLNFPIILFTLFGCISVVRGSYYDSGFIHYALIEFKRWMTPIFLFFLVLNTVKDRETIKTVAVIMMTVTTIVALMAIYEYIDIGYVSNLDKARVKGITDQPNMLAAFFNYYMFLPFGFFLLRMGKLKYWLLLIPFLICFRGIMVTFSRGGYIAFAAALYAISFFKSKKVFLFLLFVSWIVYLNPVLMPAGIRYRMGQTIHQPLSYADSIEDVEESLDSSAASRMEVWKGGLRMVADYPFFGVGYRLFMPLIRFYWSGERPIDAHNTYLIIAAEMGVPALLVFLWVIWRVFRRTHFLYRTTRDPFSKALALGFLGGLFGLLASNMFGSRLDAQEVSSYFWILAALIIRLKILDEREAERAAVTKVRKLGAPYPSAVTPVPVMETV